MSTDDEDEFLKLADEIETIEEHVRELLTPEEMERRRRACLEACRYAMPEERER